MRTMVLAAVLWSGIASAQSFSVTGEVKRPGTFPVDAPRTLLDAIALAEGPGTNADLSKIIIRRGGQDITVDLGAVLRGRSPDVPLQGGDEVRVPVKAAPAPRFLQMDPRPRGPDPIA